MQLENGSSRVGYFFVQADNAGKVKLGAQGHAQLIAVIVVMRMAAALWRIHLQYYALVDYSNDRKERKNYV
jgi:hypothetical protein